MMDKLKTQSTGVECKASSVLLKAIVLLQLSNRIATQQVEKVKVKVVADFLFLLVNFSTLTP